MLDRRVGRLLLGQFGGVKPTTKRAGEVVDSHQVINPGLPGVGQTIVGGCGISEARVTTNRRYLDGPQDRTHRRRFSPGDVGVPDRR